MFITNKRVAYPNEFKISNTTIEAMEQFKLLGVIKDNKLSFPKA